MRMDWSPARPQIWAPGLVFPVHPALLHKLGNGTIMLHLWWDWDKPRMKKDCRTECCLETLASSISSSSVRTGTWSVGDVLCLRSSLLLFPLILRTKRKVSPHGGWLSCESPCHWTKMHGLKSQGIVRNCTRTRTIL